MNSIKQQQGIAAEKHVAQTIQKNGFIILEYNYRTSRGEIDLIAKQDDAVVFIEVKMRQNPLFDPALAITVAKQKRIIFAAKQYLAAHEYLLAYTCRFDVALVERTINNTFVTTYLTNAFTE